MSLLRIVFLMKMRKLSLVERKNQPRKRKVILLTNQTMILSKWVQEIELMSLMTELHASNFNRDSNLPRLVQTLVV